LGDVQTVEVSGDHHVHLTDAAAVAGVVNAFLSRRD